MIKICTTCVLDENYPGISFDEKGICKFCATHTKKNDNKSSKEKYKQKFLGLIDTYKGKFSYDCIVAFSGGKDSTFTLHLLKTKFNLKILAFSFDNWFQSEAAHKNIRNVIKNIDVDHIMLKPRFEIFKKIIQTCHNKNIFPIAATSRTSAICTACLGIIRFIVIKTAIEKSIPFVIFGLSPGQAPVATSVFKSNHAMIEKMQKAIYEPLYRVLAEDIDSYFIEEIHFKNRKNFPYIVNPLAFFDYDEKSIYKTSENYGWVKPQDTDPNSTNCLLNSFANELHIKQYGFHPYASEIAGLIRSGSMTREEGLKRLNVEMDPDLLKYLTKMLELKY